MQLARTRAFTSTKQARNVQCRAVKVDSTSSRRQALSGVLLTTGLTLLPSRAWALIPDEEDEELLERAKANRQKRLAAQKETTRWVLPTWGVLLHSDSSRCHLPGRMQIWALWGTAASLKKSNAALRSSTTEHQH